MRAASLPLLALPLLLTYCGAKQDLIIGELAPITEAGTAGISGGGTVGGSSEGGTTEVAGGAGAAGDSGVNCIAGEEPPLGSLIHRYSFDGTGTDTTDTIAAADGTLVGGATLDGTGVASLEGNPTRQFINLPNGLVSSLTDVTIVTWITWTGGAGYQRIFDFGISDAGEVQGGSGTSYIAMMPTTGFDMGQSQGLGAEVKAAGHPTLHLASKEDILDRLVQAAFVLRSGVSAELYLDSNLLSSLTTAISLSDLDDRNNWLGQSQWSKDHNFEGGYEEVRIYDVALNSCQLSTILIRGYQTPLGAL